jgi:hypothetical protein
MKYALFTEMALSRDLPEYGLRRGDVVRLINDYLRPGSVALSGCRQVAMTVSPRAAYCLANSKPKPRSEPVMNTVAAWAEPALNRPAAWRRLLSFIPRILGEGELSILPADPSPARDRFGCKSSGRRRFQRPSKHVAERLGRPAATSPRATKATRFSASPVSTPKRSFPSHYKSKRLARSLAISRVDSSSITTPGGVRYRIREGCTTALVAFLRGVNVDGYGSQQAVSSTRSVGNASRTNETRTRSVAGWSSNTASKIALISVHP